MKLAVKVKNEEDEILNEGDKIWNEEDEVYRIVRQMKFEISG